MNAYDQARTEEETTFRSYAAAAVAHREDNPMSVVRLRQARSRWLAAQERLHRAEARETARLVRR